MSPPRAHGEGPSGPPPIPVQEWKDETHRGEPARLSRDTLEAIAALQRDGHPHVYLWRQGWIIWARTLGPFLVLALKRGRCVLVYKERLWRSCSVGRQCDGEARTHWALETAVEAIRTIREDPEIRRQLTQPPKRWECPPLTLPMLEWAEMPPRSLSRLRAAAPREPGMVVSLDGARRRRQLERLGKDRA